MTGSMLGIQHSASDKVDSYAEVPGLHGVMDDMIQHFIGQYSGIKSLPDPVDKDVMDLF